jgi:hypothetical protein
MVAAEPQILVGRPLICIGGTPHWPTQSACCLGSKVVRERTAPQAGAERASHWTRELLGPQGTPLRVMVWEPREGQRPEER